MKICFLIPLFSLLLTAVQAQHFCKKTSVYFDLNQSEVKATMFRHIDQLFAEMNGQTVIAELYGYSDTLASSEYNQLLSEKRTAAVKAYITANYPTAVRFMEKSLGEEIASSADPSLDRRVDVFLVPVSGDQLVLNTGKETVELPIDYFEPCGICNSRPKVEGIYTESEAVAANMRFETNDGDELITAGTINFNFEPCNPNKPIPKTACMSISAATLDRDMKIWEPDTIDGIIYWKESKIKPEFDAVNMRYRFCGFGRGPVNVDKRRRADRPGSGIRFPFEQVKSTFYTPQMQRIYVTPEQIIPYAWKDTIRTVVSVGTVGERLFFLKQNLQNLTEQIDTARPLNIDQLFKVPSVYYTEFIYSDTLMKVRFGRKTTVTQFGFYLADMNEFVPVKWTKNRRQFSTQKPLTACVPAIIKGETLYVLDTKEKVLKYNRHENVYTARISKKKMRVFRREKAWKGN